jgi:hypothetical protein
VIEHGLFPPEMVHLVLIGHGHQVEQVQPQRSGLRQSRALVPKAELPLSTRCGRGCSGPCRLPSWARALPTVTSMSTKDLNARRSAQQLATPCTRGGWRRIADAAHRLHATELAGESAATPAILIAEVVLFLIPILLAIAGMTFAAYYLG